MGPFGRGHRPTLHLPLNRPLRNPLRCGIHFLFIFQFHRAPRTAVGWCLVVITPLKWCNGQRVGWHSASITALQETGFLHMLPCLSWCGLKLLDVIPFFEHGFHTRSDCLFSGGGLLGVGGVDWYTSLSLSIWKSPFPREVCHRQTRLGHATTRCRQAVPVEGGLINPPPK